MKSKFLICLCVAAACMSCTSKKGNTPMFQIEGTWENGSGKTVYLKEKDGENENGRPKFVAIDSAVVKKDNTFNLSRGLENKGEIKQLFANDKRVNVIVVKDTLHATITEKEAVTKKGEPYINTTIEIQGGRDQDILKNGDELFLGKSFMRIGIMLAMGKANKDGDNARVDSLRRVGDTIAAEYEKKYRNFLDSTSNSLAAPFFIEKALLDEYPYDTTLNYYNKLTTEVKNSYPGIELKKKLDQRAQVSVGGTPADFELPTPDGGKITLSSLRGKVVLLDFWATWCGPCKKEIPNMRNVYAKYHNKGFEILSISVDKAKDKDKWLELIKSEGMTWLHGSSLDEMDGVVAKQFGITSIPQFFLLNKNGKIVAAGMDIRGEGLAPAVEKALSE